MEEQKLLISALPFFISFFEIVFAWICLLAGSVFLFSVGQVCASFRGKHL
jgi:hypothetical protein